MRAESFTVDEVQSAIDNNITSLLSKDHMETADRKKKKHNLRELCFIQRTCWGLKAAEAASQESSEGQLQRGKWGARM